MCCGRGLKGGVLWEGFEGVEVCCGRGLRGWKCVVGGGGGVLWEGVEWWEGLRVVGGVLSPSQLDEDELRDFADCL